jgi:hypothetical protein
VGGGGFISLYCALRTLDIDGGALGGGGGSRLEARCFSFPGSFSLVLFWALGDHGWGRAANLRGSVSVC